MALLSTVSRSNWNLEMLVFTEGGKPEYPKKNPRSRDENQQQTQPTYDTESGNRTRAALVGGECSDHCAIPAPCLGVHVKKYMYFLFVCVFKWSLLKDKNLGPRPDWSPLRVNFNISDEHPCPFHMRAPPPPLQPREFAL